MLFSQARSLNDFAMVKDGAKVPIKAAQASKKEAAKESKGSKCAGLPNTYLSYLPFVWLQHTAHLCKRCHARLPNTCQGQIPIARHCAIQHG